MARQDERLEATEEMLIEAWGLLMRSPDREKGFLMSGRRSGWPEIVRRREDGDYAEGYDPAVGLVVDAPRPRLQLGKRDVALMERVFLAEKALALEVAPANRALVGLVLSMKARPDAGGFRWERVWELMGGKQSGLTTRSIRARYERSLARIAFVEAQRLDPLPI